MRVAPALRGRPPAGRPAARVARLAARHVAAPAAALLLAASTLSVAAQPPSPSAPSPTAPSPSAPSAPRRLTVAEAVGRATRALPDTVLVAGRATVASGVLQTRAFDVAIDDGTGGIRIFDRDMHAVRVGDSIEAAGVVQRYRGTAEMFATHIRVVPAAPRLAAPIELPAPRLGDGFEGRLVRVRVQVVESGWSEGGRWFTLAALDAGDDDADDARAQAQAGSHALTLWLPASHAERPQLDRYLPGDRLEVTGIVATFRDNPVDAPAWQLIPRGTADVRAIGIPRRWVRLGLAVLGGLAACGGVALALARLLTRRSARALEETEARYEQLLALSPAAVLVQARGRVLFANAAAARLLGAPDARALAGHSVADFACDDDPRALGDGGAAADAPAETGRARVRTLAGGHVEVEVTRSPCRYHESAASVVILRDITEELRREEELRAMAYVDELTGLLNRRGFAVLAEAALRRARATRRAATLVFADVDGLKRINDAHGHAAGDEAIRTVARALAGSVRRTDVVARWSGDEFVALLVDGEQAPPGSDDDLTSRFHQALVRESAGDRPFAVGASLGAARLAGDDATPEADALAVAFSRADARLYVSKAARAGAEAAAGAAR